MNLYYTITPKDVYGLEVVPEDYRGFEIVAFRPPREGETYLSAAGLPKTAPHNYRDVFLILRRKEKKYRYVTDGTMRLPRPGEYYFNADDNQINRAGTDQFLDNNGPRLIFTREEVPE